MSGETSIIQDAWARGQQVAVHSWIYGLNNGRVQDLGMRVTEREALPSAYDSASQTGAGLRASVWSMRSGNPGF